MRTPTSSGSNNTLRALLVIVALSLLAIIGYRKWVSPLGYTSVPQELQLTYIPSDYTFNLDEENALAILSDPQRYRREFNDLVYDINLSILFHVAKRMNLTEVDRDVIREEYEKHHPYLRNLYYNDFLALMDSTSQLYQIWYDNEGTNATQVLHEVASKYTCFLVTQIMTSLVPTKGGSIFARGQNVETPCGLAMQEALNPLMKKLEERAAIRDFARSRNILQEKVERTIAELATMEVRDKKGLNKQMRTKVMGFNVSSTDIDITAISVLKVGFRLDQQFDISLNAKQGLVIITLPEPTILSHEVYPKVDHLSIGWLRELKEEDFNRTFNVLRAEFRREALESDIMERSKTQAIELMNNMFGPAISGLNSRYKLQVRFQAPSQDRSFEPEANREWESR
jgi:hypothetical protein